MNTSAISQSPAAADAPDRSVSQQRVADTEDGGFPGLLSKLAGNRERTDRQEEPAREPRSGGGDGSQGTGRWRGDSEMLSDSELAARPEQVPGVGGLTDIDMTVLMQALSGGGIPAGLDGLAAIAGRIAQGTQTEADTALMRSALVSQNDRTPSAEQLILARLAKVAGRGGEPAAGDIKRVTATLTVLRRETHFAPTQTAAAMNDGMQRVAQVAARGNRAAFANALPGATTPDSGEAQLLPGNAMARAAQTHLVAPQSAVTAAGGAELGMDWRQNNSPATTADALSTPGGEQTLSVARTDALPNAGLGSGVIHQIVDRVVGEASTLTAQVGRPDTPALVVRHESPVKTLHIQLQPADLGTVAIRMSVKGGVLRLEIETGRGETAHMIQRDRDALSALLRSAGYLIEGVDVRHADQSGASAQMGTNQGSLPMQGGQSGSSHAEGRPPGERPQGDRRNNQFGSRSNGEDENAGRSPDRGGIYI